eukprot:Gregarina_sp_Poly_1__5880@NODE_309_length_9633_cov_123_442714_g266_i0_p1_GENE_NODE_309_length_9633_cov_123_442714_g266_i0NODE_309_length_9633_cov_123_442714_g266_i0_p1_ORF_typecomplete_len1544_score263_37SMC_N/PF02463_19/1e05VPS38/PF17649_1/0_00093DUF572/PF04502_13/0_033IMCp/PF12314_8/13IMCp/PF12314_8/8IMCp/PF12314_8/68_NODE_309_length_9633_cov_123_442714_g266_i039018532
MQTFASPNDNPGLALSPLRPRDAPPVDQTGTGVGVKRHRRRGPRKGRAPEPRNAAPRDAETSAGLGSLDIALLNRETMSKASTKQSCCKQPRVDTVETSVSSWAMNEAAPRISSVSSSQLVSAYVRAASAVPESRPSRSRRLRSRSDSPVVTRRSRACCGCNDEPTPKNFTTVVNRRRDSYDRETNDLLTLPVTHSHSTFALPPTFPFPDLDKPEAIMMNSVPASLPVSPAHWVSRSTSPPPSRIVMDQPTTLHPPAVSTMGNTILLPPTYEQHLLPPQPASSAAAGTVSMTGTQFSTSAPPDAMRENCLAHVTHHAQTPPQTASVASALISSTNPLVSQNLSGATHITQTTTRSGAQMAQPPAAHGSAQMIQAHMTDVQGGPQITQGASHVTQSSTQVAQGVSHMTQSSAQVTQGVTHITLQKNLPQGHDRSPSPRQIQEGSQRPVHYGPQSPRLIQGSTLFPRTVPSPPQQSMALSPLAPTGSYFASAPAPPLLQPERPSSSPPVEVPAAQSSSSQGVFVQRPVYSPPQDSGAGLQPQTNQQQHLINSPHYPQQTMGTNEVWEQQTYGIGSSPVQPSPSPVQPSSSAGGNNLVGLTTTASASASALAQDTYFSELHKDGISAQAPHTSPLPMTIQPTWSVDPRFASQPLQPITTQAMVSQSTEERLLPATSFESATGALPVSSTHPQQDFTQQTSIHQQTYAQQQAYAQSEQTPLQQPLTQPVVPDTIAPMSQAVTVAPFASESIAAPVQMQLETVQQAEHLKSGSFEASREASTATGSFMRSVHQSGARIRSISQPVMPTAEAAAVRFDTVSQSQHREYSVDMGPRNRVISHTTGERQIVEQYSVTNKVYEVESETLDLKARFGAENVGVDELGEYVLKRIEVPIIEERVVEVKKTERREKVIEVKVPKYEIKEIVVEKPDIRYIDTVKEIEVPEIKVVYKSVKQVVDRPVEVRREVRVPEIRKKEQIKEVPGEIIEVPKPFLVNRPVIVPKYVDRRVPTVVAQSFWPIVTEANPEDQHLVMDIECRVVNFVTIPLPVPLPLPVYRPLIFDRAEMRHKEVLSHLVPNEQYNALIKILNPSLVLDNAVDLFRFVPPSKVAELQGEWYNLGELGVLPLTSGPGCAQVAVKPDTITLPNIERDSVSVETAPSTSAVPQSHPSTHVLTHPVPTHPVPTHPVHPSNLQPFQFQFQAHEIQEFQPRQQMQQILKPTQEQQYHERRDPQSLQQHRELRKLQEEQQFLQLQRLQQEQQMQLQQRQELQKLQQEQEQQQRFATQVAQESAHQSQQLTQQDQHTLLIQQKQQMEALLQQKQELLHYQSSLPQQLSPTSTVRAQSSGGKWVGPESATPMADRLPESLLEPGARLMKPNFPLWTTEEDGAMPKSTFSAPQPTSGVNLMNLSPNDLAKIMGRSAEVDTDSGHSLNPPKSDIELEFMGHRPAWNTAAFHGHALPTDSNSACDTMSLSLFSADSCSSSASSASSRSRGRKPLRRAAPSRSSSKASDKGEAANKNCAAAGKGPSTKASPQDRLASLLAWAKQCQAI